MFARKATLGSLVAATLAAVTTSALPAPVLTPVASAAASQGTMPAIGFSHTAVWDDPKGLYSQSSKFGIEPKYPVTKVHSEIQELIDVNGNLYNDHGKDYWGIRLLDPATGDPGPVWANPIDLYFEAFPGTTILSNDPNALAPDTIAEYGADYAADYLLFDKAGMPVPIDPVTGLFVLELPLNIPVNCTPPNCTDTGGQELIVQFINDDPIAPGGDEHESPEAVYFRLIGAIDTVTGAQFPIFAQKSIVRQIIVDEDNDRFGA